MALADIKRNESYIIDITGMTHDGQGVGRVNNFTVFVEGALPGEKVDVLIIKVTTSYATGKLKKIIKAAGERAIPFCTVYEKCGGCNLQHLSYEAQLKFKTDTVSGNIKRIGKLEDVLVHDTLGMTNNRNYRNKAQYPVGIEEDRPAVGFYAGSSHRIIENDVCGIQDELSDKVKSVVRNFMLENKIEPYIETSRKGLVRHIVTRVAFKTGEIMVVVAINGRDLPAKDRLVKSLISEIPVIKSIYLNINTQRTAIVLGDKNIKIYGEDRITDYIGDFKFYISPLSFFQVNPVQTEVLYGKALEYAGLTGNETVFDLYCGIGTIALFLSRKAKKVYGVEVVEDAILDAEQNAKLNNIENVEFIAGASEKVILDMYKQGIKADVVVVDPPRKGCDETLLETLVKMQPERIVYVSCNPSTLARDLRYLDEKGYRAVEVQPVDMFPWTSHVECVTMITNSGLKGK